MGEVVAVDLVVDVAPEKESVYGWRVHRVGQV